MSETKLRVEQWRTEPPDLFLLRVFSKVAPMLDDNALLAAVDWMASKKEAILIERHKKPSKP